VVWTQGRLIVVLGVWTLFRALTTIAGAPSTIASRAIRRLGSTHSPPIRARFGHRPVDRPLTHVSDSTIPDQPSQPEPYATPTPSTETKLIWTNPG
jgi:hypothetical protein